MIGQRSMFVVCFTLAVTGVHGGLRNAWSQEAESLIREGLFDSTKLLNVEIELPEKDWQSLCLQARDFASSFRKDAPPNPYTYFKGDVTVNGIKLPSVGIRKKGFFGSMDQRRPSLKIKFNEFGGKQELDGLDRLTLNNNKQDRAHVSQLLAYSLFRKAGLPAPRFSLARVTVNGRAMGIYGNVESIKKPFLRSQFGSSSGDLFEGAFPTDFFTDRIARFEIKKGKNRDRLIQIAKLLEKSEPESLEKLEEYIDLDQFLRHWAMESLIGFWDGYGGNQNNFFLYQHPKNSKFYFIPWGADFAFSQRFQRGPSSVKAKGLLAYRLNQHPAYRQKYHAQLMDLLQNVWDEKELLAEVDRIQGLVEDHLHADQEGLSDAAAATRTFIQNRRQAILEETKDGPVRIETPPDKPMYFKEMGSLAGAFQAVWNGDASQPPSSPGEAKLELTLSGDQVELAGIRVSAGPGRAFRGFGRPGNEDVAPPPTLTLVGERKQDGEPIRVSIRFAPGQFRTHDRATAVQGMVTVGQAVGFGRGMLFVGQVRLAEAGVQQGAKISGTVEGRFYQMQGGFGGGRRPPPRRSNRD